MTMSDRPSSRTRAASRGTGLGAFAYGVLGSAMIAAALLVSAILDSRPAAAQSACGDRAAVLKNLERARSETPLAMGLSTEGTMIEGLVSSAGNWTILVTYPNRQSCLVAAGENWESMPAVASGPRV